MRSGANQHPLLRYVGNALFRAPGSSHRHAVMLEISRLAETLADRFLMRQEAGIEIPPELFRMLVHSAQYLHDRQVPWPPSVESVLMEVARLSGSMQARNELIAFEPQLIDHDPGN